jgi:thiamine-monophosphate kinase
MPVSERALIARIRARARNGPALVAGIGDDCSILRMPPGTEALVTTDFSLENVHFRRAWHPPEVVGHRCLARGLSDIAAMGGDPTAFFLSLALPARLPQTWVDHFLTGMLRLARQFRVPLAGGDTAQSPGGILADIVVVGSIPRGRAILRSGARPGDLLYVTGELGAGAAALDLLLRSPQRVSAASLRTLQAAYPRHFQPIPRLAAGRFLRAHRLASAMIDLSDGLSTDLSHICQESRVGADVNAAAIPRAKTAGRAAGRSTSGQGAVVDLRFALHGGDDYELLFTAPPKKRIPSQIAGVRVTPIGQITRRRSVTLVAPDGTRSPLAPQGWEHLRNRSTQ